MALAATFFFFFFFPTMAWCGGKTFHAYLRPQKKGRNPLKVNCLKNPVIVQGRSLLPTSFLTTWAPHLNADFSLF